MREKLRNFILLFVFVCSTAIAANNVKPQVDKLGYIRSITTNDILVNGYGVPYAVGNAGGTWGSITGNISGQTDLWNQLSARYTTNQLGSTTFGSEGFRLIGALGGYNLARFQTDFASKGPARDMPVFNYTLFTNQNLNVSWSEGDVYSPEDGYYKLSAGSNTLVDNSVNYAYWSISNPNQILWTTGNRANIANDVIPLGTFTCSFGMILHVGDTTPIGDMTLRMDDSHYQVFPSIITTGLNYVPTGTNFNQISQVGGIEVHNMNENNVHSSKVLTNCKLVTMFHTNTSQWGFYLTNALDVTHYDNGTNLVSCVLSNWYRGLFISITGNTNMDWVYPVGSYTNYSSCLAADDPQMPSGFEPYIPRCTAYIFQGGDTNLRTATDYWIDRRFRIIRGAVSVSSGGGNNASVPSLFQVLSQSKASGGLLMDGLGDPANDDQVASKHYVDSNINHNNSGRAFVSTRSGDDSIAQLNSAIKPFKTIQAAINAAGIVATDMNRYIIDIAPGDYYENLTMMDDVGLRGADIEASTIHGTVTYPPAYKDISGSEVALLTIKGSNTPCIIMNPGDDLAYMGVRSCYLTTSYYNGQTNKSVITFTRGIGEVYGTTYEELYLIPTNGSGNKMNAQIFEHTSDPSNPGLSRFTSFNSSAHIFSSDTNDDIALVLTHDNTDAKCINTMMGTAFDVDLMQVPGIYSNFVHIVSQENAQGRTLSMGTVTRLFMDYTNNVTVLFGYSSGGPTDNVAIVRGNHVRMSVGSTSNIFIGAATGINDRIRVYDSVYIQNYADQPYPKIYTNDGTAGKFFINTVTENGDQLFGGAVDFSAVNTISGISTPAVGHLKMYAGTYAGLENPYFKDSSGNIVRQARDSFYNGFNTEVTPLKVGESVYIVKGSLSPDLTPKVARSIANNIDTLPAIGIVSQIGGIATGSVGRIMISGRLENGCDTSMYQPGEKLYVSETIAGGFTNVAPTGTNIAQEIGTVHVSSTNGYISVRMWSPDTLGGLTEIAYARSTNTSLWDSAYAWVNINSNAIQNGTGSWNQASIDSTYSTNYIINNSNAIAYTIGRTGVWNTAYTWVNNNSNSVAYIFSRSNVWNESYTYVNSNSNGINYVLSRSNTWDGTTSTVNAMPTGNWNTAYTWVNANSSSVTSAFSNTSNWNTAYTWVNNNSNSVTSVFNTTGNWNTAYSWVNLNSNGVASAFSNTSNWNTAYSWVNSNSNKDSYVWSRTNTWDGTTSTVNAMPTGNWNVAYSWVNNNSNGVSSALANTSNWNTAYSWVNNNSNNITSVINNTSNWNTAYTYINSNSNGLNYILGRSNTWDGTTSTVNAMPTSNWNTAYTWVNNNSNNASSVFNTTGNWNTAYTWVNANSSGVASVLSNTGLWNTVSGVSNIATFASNGVVSINGNTNTYQTAYNIAVSNNTWLSNNTNNIQNATNDTLQTVLTRNNTAATSIFLTNSDNVIAIGATNQTSAKLYVKGDNGTLTNAPLVLIEGSVGRNNDFLQITGSGGSTTNFRVAKDGSWYQGTSIIQSNNLLYSGGNVVITNISAYSAFTSSKFKSNIGNVNITTATGAAIIPMTNNIYISSSGVYSNAQSRWYPKQTNVMVRISGGNNYATLASGDFLVLSIYKNGTNIGDVAENNPRMNSGTSDVYPHWEMIDFPTSTNDYYELWTGSRNALGASRTTINAGSNNWWTGETLLK